MPEAVMWFWELVMALNKRCDVLGDRADLQVLLGPYLSWSWRGIGVGCPSLDRALSDQRLRAPE
jgi:hypothetical protein